MPLDLVIQSKFHPRPYQLKILQALDKGIKRAVWCVHRRGGKDHTIFNWCITELLKTTCTCFYVLPTYSQAKKVIWDAINNDGFRIIDYIPKEVIESINSQEMKIRLVNGSLFQLIGSDNIDSLMGTNPRIVVFSEYALQDPKAWDYIRPILKVNGGYAIFISTPRGKNHFYDLYCMAKTNGDWFCELLTIDDTHVLTAQDIEEEMREGMSEELALQEYYCSFDRGIDGSYYGKLIEKAREEDRICRVLYEPRAPVNTAWDVGFGDSTSIVFWQQVGGELRIIDAYENHGESIAHYIQHLNKKPYVYGKHFFPHDAGSGSIQTGKTLQEIAYDLGLKTEVLKRDDLQAGIEVTRAMLQIAFIDATKCSHLIKCLENYHKKFNDKTNSYSQTPVHDCWSHMSDAVRYMANARIEYGSGVGNLTPDKIKEMRQAHGYK